MRPKSLTVEQRLARYRGERRRYLRDYGRHYRAEADRKPEPAMTHEAVQLAGLAARLWDAIAEEPRRTAQAVARWNQARLDGSQEDS